VKVVLDTNVVVSGIFFAGPPYEILNSWRRGSFKLLLSEAIFDEYQRVATNLRRKYSGVNISAFLRLLALGALWVDAPELGVQVSEDPDDDKFIACALAGNAKVIVSGDRHLINISSHKGVTILTPRVFVETLFKK